MGLPQFHIAHKEPPEERPHETAFGTEPVAPTWEDAKKHTNTDAGCGFLIFLAIVSYFATSVAAAFVYQSHLAPLFPDLGLVAAAVGTWVAFFRIGLGLFRNAKINAKLSKLTESWHDKRLAWAIRRDAIRASDLQKAIEKRKTDLQKAINATRELERRACSLLNSSDSMAQNLPTKLSWALGWLASAEEEFKQHAYAPFWNAIEEASKNLDAFDRDVRNLSDNARSYYSILQNQVHTFPSFNVRVDSLPDPACTIKELKRLVRLGQTDFHFATIWEHRQTREVLIAGFTTLGEAVDKLGSVVERSVRDLHDSLSSDNARGIEEQIRQRDTVIEIGEAVDERLLDQIEMLDNIQRRRVPDR